MRHFQFDKQFFAWWWLPDNPEDVVPGYASISRGESVTVHTLGSFISVNDDSWRMIIPVVYGKDSYDNLITLCDVHVSGQLTPEKGIFRQVDFHSDRVLLGVHSPTPKPLAKEMIFIPSGIKEWAASDEELHLKYDKDSQHYIARVPGKGKESLVAQLNSNCTLYLEFFHWPTFSLEKSTGIEHWCRCRVMFSESETLDRCIELIRIFCDLLSFGTRIMSGIESYSILLESDDSSNEGSNWIEVLGLNSAVKSSALQRQYGRGGRNYFTIKDIEVTFEETLRKWFDGVEKYGSAYYLYFALARRGSDTFLQNEFFTYVQSLEGFRKKDSHKGRFMERSDYRVLVDNVLYPTLIDQAGEDLALAMRSKLYMANEWTLREHLREIVKKRGDHFVKHWVPEPDIEVWIGFVVQARNDYAHVLDESDSDADTRTPFFIDTVIALRVLVEAQLLEMMGFSSTKSDEILMNTYKSESRISV
jgi:hypothetical protein